MRALAALAVIAAAAGPARADMECFSGPMSPTALASDGVAGSGGMIVASGGALPDWWFRAGNRLVRGEVTTIAPGLALYHPPPTVPGIDLQLESRDGQVHATASRALAIGPVGPAPAIAAIRSEVRRNGHVWVVATFARPAPGGTLLAIVSRVNGATLTPLTWAPVRKLDADVTIWHTPEMCEETIPQSTQPKLGDTVVVSWVDGAGRVSEPSKPIVISRGSAGK